MNSLRTVPSELKGLFVSDMVISGLMLVDD